MRAVKEPPAYRYARPERYLGGTRRDGPVRRGFAVRAIACAVLVVAIILAVGLLA